MAGEEQTSRPERAIIGKSLEIPRMISGLWQLAGGHDKDVDITNAASSMTSLWVLRWETEENPADIKLEFHKDWTALIWQIITEMLVGPIEDSEVTV